MSFIQFRVHPSVGIARYGDSQDVYYVGSDFPQFMQEEFPKTRNLPKSRTHPSKLTAAANWPASNKKTGTLGTYKVFDNSLGADTNYKDNNNKIKPQAARFRVFAYVYNKEGSKHPRKVFEVDADTADITWNVQLANRKSHESGSDKDVIILGSLEAKQSLAATLEAKRMKTGTRPTLAYLMLERKSTNKNRFTGRLHLIGNEGECKGTTETSSLWSDDWIDSGCDGPVRAKIKIKDLNAFKTRVTRHANEDVKYLDSTIENSVAAAVNSEVTAVPAWAVIGPPDYCPDMGHFVSVWDLGLNGAMECATNGKVKAQPKIHKQIKCKCKVERYRKVDYLIHIHPQLCLFSDAIFISGAAKGGGAQKPGHNNNQVVSNTDTPRGLTLNVRDAAQKAEMMDVTAQKDKAQANLNNKKKPAIYSRLRPAGTLYTYFKKTRHFFERKKGEPIKQTKTLFPRNLGRRVGYESAQAARHTPAFVFPNYPGGISNLRAFHSSTNAQKSLAHLKGKACGKTKDLTNKDGDLIIDGEQIKLVDDMFWPVTMNDMPMLRDLAYTHLQNWQFKIWSSQGGAKMSHLFSGMISNALKTALETGTDDRDLKFDTFALACPKHVPALIDMAYAGSMLGGSFLPGIEAGREAAVATNWTLMHGASDDFPDIRFNPCTETREHFAGRMTKDLAIPWQKDFIACDEAFWPTSRPGIVQEIQGPNEVTVEWEINSGDYPPPVPAIDPDRVLKTERFYFNRYWKDLGFIKREPNDRFINREVQRP